MFSSGIADVTSESIEHGASSAERDGATRAGAAARADSAQSGREWNAATKEDPFGMPVNDPDRPANAAGQTFGEISSTLINGSSGLHGAHPFAEYLGKGFGKISTANTLASHAMEGRPLEGVALAAADHAAGRHPIGAAVSATLQHTASTPLGKSFGESVAADAAKLEDHPLAQQYGGDFHLGGQMPTLLQAFEK